MTVQRLQSISMPHQNVITITVTVIGFHSHDAVKNTIDGIAGSQFQIGTMMPSVSAETKFGIDLRVVQWGTPVRTEKRVVEFDMNGIFKICGVEIVNIDLLAVPR